MRFIRLTFVISVLTRLFATANKKFFEDPKDLSAVEGAKRVRWLRGDRENHALSTTSTRTSVTQYEDRVQRNVTRAPRGLEIGDNTMSATAIITGNLTADPELKTLASGAVVCNFSLAYNPTLPDGGRGEVNFYDVAAWRDLAVNFAASAKKGDRVMVNANIRQNAWTNEEGQKRTRTVFNARDIAFSCLWAQVETTRVVRQNGATEEPVEGEDIFAS